MCAHLARVHREGWGGPPMASVIFQGLRYTTLARSRSLSHRETPSAAAFDPRYPLYARNRVAG